MVTQPGLGYLHWPGMRRCNYVAGKSTIPHTICLGTLRGPSKKPKVPHRIPKQSDMAPKCPSRYTERRLSGLKARADLNGKEVLVKAIRVDIGSA